jgi:hypothetical protein
MVPSGVKVYLAGQPVDFRKGPDSLLSLVRDAGSDPFSGLLSPAPACYYQALMANPALKPVERCGMWWQCSIQRAASPASIAIVTMAIRGT